MPLSAHLDVASVARYARYEPLTRDLAVSICPGTFKMRNHGSLSLWVAALLSLILLGCGGDPPSNDVAPKVENGRLDLRNWDLKNDGPVALDGQWDFFWNTHLKPDDFSSEMPEVNGRLIAVPGTWNGLVVEGRKIHGAGYATYRIHVHLAKAGQRLAFKFLDMATSFSVYVDGKKILSCGVPGTRRGSTTPT